MPANIAHMLIAHKALEKLKQKGVEELEDFAKMLDGSKNNDRKSNNYERYMNLGSLGPDLFYYADIGRSVKNILIERYRKAKAMTPWSYHLHSHSPNEFSLKLIELVFRDVDRKKDRNKGDRDTIVPDADDVRKLSYIAGHLTHIAADQIIHPLVNRVAGPYYRSGENRVKHRECEVFQDYFLYEEVYRVEGKSGPLYEFFEQKFHEWIDCVKRVPGLWECVRYLIRRRLFLICDFRDLIRSTMHLVRFAIFKNTERWFGYFLQRGFAETYGIFPSEEEIEDSTHNLGLTLWVCQRTGPYKTAAEDYEKNNKASGMYQEYIKGLDDDLQYMNHYQLAVELAVVYLIALYEVYFVLKERKDFTDERKERFSSIVSDADLSCPLKHNIFDKACEALRNEKDKDEVVERHFSQVLTKIEFRAAKEILETKNDTNDDKD